MPYDPFSDNRDRLPRTVDKATVTHRAFPVADGFVIFYLHVARRTQRNANAAGDAFRAIDFYSVEIVLALSAEI